MKILVTGGAGFIGSHVVERLLSQGHSALVVDNFATARRDTLAGARPGLELVEGTIADASLVDALFARFRPDVVLHCAAAYKDPDDWVEDSRTNVIGSVNVVKASRAAKVRRLIYFQTALCYGNHPHEQPVTVSHPLEPDSSYAISKTAGERYILTSGLDVISFRLANMYGPRNLSGPVPTFFSRLAEGKGCFAVNTRRDFLFVADLVEVVIPAVEGRGRPGVYHVSTGTDASIRELYDAVASAMGVNRPVEERERGADDAPTILLDPSKTAAEFGWKAVTPLRDGIAQTVAWYRTHGVGQTYTHLRLPD
ncbi:MAG: NAD-dependent epimerase/dehydratase family protein [Candidatus Rokubacteria bacterium]|nr:NAD-dependent epimerase/dehydratase family protein [Candidatus Rokubacteria bacterium]